MMYLLQYISFALVSSATYTVADMAFRLGPSQIEARLPKPLSDVSASVGGNGLIYIAGGCDSAFGSQFDEVEEVFHCNSVSDSLYAFDPETNVFTQLADMPEPRFRHAAVAINNQLWLVGGRDENDSVVGNVDVYDIADGSWRTFDDLYDKYWVSDLGGFAANDRAFFVGGFTDDYRAVRRVFSIDPVDSLNEDRLDVLRHSNLIHRRGDVGVTVNANETFAYVSGGASHVNQFCAPLSSVEKYDLVNNTGWEEMSPLVQGRSGKTVVQLRDQLIALGGAQEARKLCNATSRDPGSLQIPVYEVEVFNHGNWDVVDSLADYRFRSTSVAYNDAIYSFGGQSVYFSVCKCHPTVDEVVIYRETDEPYLTGYPTYDYYSEPQPEPADATSYPQSSEYETTTQNDGTFGGYNRAPLVSSGCRLHSVAPETILTLFLGVLGYFIMIN